jgi:hypothetical protein
MTNVIEINQILSRLANALIGMYAPVDPSGDGARPGY